jgi:thiosulfate reductase cytochrome b subunit
MYSRYERIWHWLQASIILALIVTGFEIHAPESYRLLGFETAVSIHYLLGFLLIVNAFLGLFYHLSTGEIGQYFSTSPDFVTMAFRQAAYYLRGMFRGERHPFERERHRKLNPLQKLTYIAILNVLLPVQVLTGLLLWGTQRWPDTVGRIGGLPILGAVHTIGSWLFVAFVVMHIYLTTTGRTPLANMWAMITGWEEAERVPKTTGMETHSSGGSDE